MPSCSHGQPCQCFQSLPLIFSFWSNLSCGGELWRKMIFGSDLLRGPLFATKNEGGIPEICSLDLLFLVLHCFSSLMLSPQRRDGCEDICLSLSGSRPISCVAKPHCMFSCMWNKTMYIPCSCWDYTYPLTCLERDFKMLSSFRTIIPCWNLLQQRWADPRTVSRSALTFFLLKGDSAYRAIIEGSKLE